MTSSATRVARRRAGLAAVPAPLSRVTAAALGDTGYRVDPSQGDPFELAAAAAPTVRPSDDHRLLCGGEGSPRGEVRVVDVVTGELRRSQQR